MHGSITSVFGLVFIFGCAELISSATVLPANPRPPHGCYNYGLCTQPKKTLVSSDPVTYEWGCKSVNDCVCVNGTTNGTYACSSIVNQCSGSPCGTDPNQHFVCTSQIGSHICTCATGWSGENCDVSANSACGNDPCINGGTCNDMAGGTYNCTCADGYSGQRCQFFDFCGKNTTCKNGAQCINLYGGTNFTCNCTWKNTQGRYCELADTKHSDPEQAVCYKYDNVLNDKSKYPYYFDDNYMTLEKCRDKMQQSINVVFEVYTVVEKRCYLSNDTYIPGWNKVNDPEDDWKCTKECPGDSDEWCGKDNDRAIIIKYDNVGPDPNPCKNNATICGPNASVGTCVNMQSPDDDEDESGDGNSTTTAATGGYFCICAPEFTGTNCEQNMTSPCADEPCQNNGTCIADDVLHTYKCNCTIDYYGKDCQYEKKCTSTTCSYGGTCIEDEDGTTSCECLTYYTGDYCEQVDRCAYDNPCINGTCVSTPDGIDPTAYTCQCAPGYTGQNCQNETNECVPNQCQLQSTCVDKYLNYECMCLPGTTGRNCEININDCTPVIYNGAPAPTPCNTKDSGAVCNDQVNGYTCTCTSQWVGASCDMNVIIRDVLLAIYGEINLDMVPLLEELMKNPVLIKDMVPYFLGMKTYEERLALSWSADDLFDWIAYEMKTIDPNLGLYIFNDIVLGNCFTFNKNLNPNYTYVMRDDGTLNGMLAKIRLRQDEYVPWTDTASIMTFVASREDYIFAESVRYSAEPSGTTAFDVFDTRYTRLGGHYGTCIKESTEVKFYYYPAAYATEGCLRSCYQKMVNDSCGCFDPRYPFPMDGSPCQLSERPCVEEASTENGDPSTWSWCVCPPACYNQLYNVQWSRTEYPKDPPECPDSTDTACIGREMDTVIVSIRMAKLEYSLYEEIPAMDFNKFISYLGGLLGVLMGVSIISFIEFFFLIFRLWSIIVSGKNI